MAQDQNLNQPSSTGDFLGNPSTPEREVSIDKLDSYELEKLALSELDSRIEQFIRKVIGDADDVLLTKVLLIIKKRLTGYTSTSDIKKIDRKITDLTFDAVVQQHEYMKHNDVVVKWIDKFGDIVFTNRLCPYDLVIGESDEKLLSDVMSMVKSIKKEKQLEEREKQLEEKEKQLEEKEKQLEEREKQYNELREKVAEIFELYTSCDYDP